MQQNSFIYLFLFPEVVVVFMVCGVEGRGYLVITPVNCNCNWNLLCWIQNKWKSGLFCLAARMLDCNYMHD